MLVNVTIGPLPARSARVWLAAARQSIALLRQDRELAVDAGVIAAFERYVDAWDSCAQGDVFEWSEDVDIAEVRHIGLHWAHIATISRSGHPGLSAAPPEAAAFYAAIAQAIGDVLALGEPDVVARDFNTVVPGFDESLPHTRAESIRVLVVDDNEDMRLLLRLAIERAEDISVVAEAVDGPAAVEAVRRTAVDVVVLDVEMPGMSGIDAIPILRAADPRIAIVMYTSARERDRALAAGADAYLDKAAPMAAVLAAIRSAG